MFYLAMLSLFSGKKDLSAEFDTTKESFFGAHPKT